MGLFQNVRVDPVASTGAPIRPNMLRFLLFFEYSFITFKRFKIYREVAALEQFSSSLSPTARPGSGIEIGFHFSSILKIFSN